MTILLGISCASKINSEVEVVLSSFLNENNQPISLSESQVLFIIPLEGCMSCINACLDFVSRRYDHKNFHAVITQSSGKKGTKLRAGNEIYTNAKIIKDFDNELVKQNIVSVDPLIFFFEKGELKKSVKVNSDNIQQFFNEIDLFLNKR